MHAAGHDGYYGSRPMASVSDHSFQFTNKRYSRSVTRNIIYMIISFFRRMPLCGEWGGIWETGHTGELRSDISIMYRVLCKCWSIIFLYFELGLCCVIYCLMASTFKSIIIGGEFRYCICNVITWVMHALRERQYENVRNLLNIAEYYTVKWIY